VVAVSLKKKLIGKDGKILHTYGKVWVQVHSRELLEVLESMA